MKPGRGTSQLVNLGVAVVMFLAIGGDTEEQMLEEVWELTGACDALKATGRPCDYDDGIGVSENSFHSSTARYRQLLGS